MINEGFFPGLSKGQAIRNYIKACGKGVLKVMSKMGISTVASYTGAQVFEAIGLGHELVDEYFTGTASRSGASGSTCSPRRWRPDNNFALPRPSRGARAPRAVAGRRVPVAPRGRVPPLQPGDGVQAAARDPRQALRRVQAVHDARERPVRAAGDAARLVQVQGEGRAPAGADRRGRAGRGDREAVLDRRDVATARSRRKRTRTSPSR